MPNTINQETQRDELLELMKSSYLPDAELPYHGVSHPDAVWSHARAMIDRLRLAGVEIDETALRRGIVLHDSLGHINPDLLGYRTAEELAANVVYKFSKTAGASEIEARRAESVVLATSPFYRPRTAEEIIARSCDLANVAGSYEEFSAATRKFHEENVLRSGRPTPFEQWLPRSFQYLGLFLWPMLELTPQAYDASGRSQWHTRALSNIIRTWRETYGDSRPVVVEILEAHQMGRRWSGSGDSLWIGIQKDERDRENFSARMIKSDGGTQIVVPGAGALMPLPDRCADEVVLPNDSLEFRREAERVSRQGASVHTISRVQHVEKEDSLRGWSAALENLSAGAPAAGVLEGLRVPMAERYRRLKAEGLISIPVCSERADVLCADVEAAARNVGWGPLYAFIEPADGKSSSKRWHGKLEVNQLKAKVQQVVGVQALSEYVVTIQPAFEILYNANVMVRHDGSVSAEFCSGKDLPSRAGTRILFSAWRDELSGMLRYSSKELAEREIAYRVLSAIPGDGSGRERNYRPGYYEIAVARAPSGSGILPLFFDFRDDEFFIGKPGNGNKKSAA